MSNIAAQPAPPPVWRVTRDLQLEPAAPTADPILLTTAPEGLSSLKDKIAALTDEKWEYYKKITNPYELIFTMSTNTNIPPSVCAVKPLSRSYFKMVEMIHTFGLYTICPKNIKTGHVCEGPGGFIQALYDTAGRSGMTLVKTYAMTLKPTHQYVPGWKRAATFLKRNGQIKILYGDTGTGDILLAANRDAYVREARRSIHIFTADGGVDFTSNFRGQEQTIFPILVASSLIALRSLVNGGVFILKVFDCFGQNTIDLLAGLGALFRQWTLYKPVTSRPCNSEQYFVGIDFNVAAPLLQVVIDTLEACLRLSRFTHRLWRDVPAELAASLLDEQFERVERQMENLEWTFSLAEEGCDASTEERLWMKNVRLCQEFCRKHRLPQVVAGGGGGH